MLYLHCSSFIVFYFLRKSTPWARAFSFTRFLDHTQRCTTVGRTPLDEWSARRRDLYQTTHNTHDIRPSPRWDSNPQSQQASGGRPTPYTARPLGPAYFIVYHLEFSSWILKYQTWKLVYPGQRTSQQYRYCHKQKQLPSLSAWDVSVCSLEAEENKPSICEWEEGTVHCLSRQKLCGFYALITVNMRATE